MGNLLEQIRGKNKDNVTNLEDSVTNLYFKHRLKDAVLMNEFRERNNKSQDIVGDLGLMGLLDKARLEGGGPTGHLLQLGKL